MKGHKDLFGEGREKMILKGNPGGDSEHRGKVAKAALKENTNSKKIVFDQNGQPKPSPWREGSGKL